MEAITKRFIVPLEPKRTHIQSIYPWENDYFALFYQQLYNQAVKTGYEGTITDFRNDVGKFLNDISNVTLYDGQYSVIPLPYVEQILRTTKTILSEDVIVAPIPYYETSNNAGGYTVIIGGE